MQYTLSRPGSQGRVSAENVTPLPAGTLSQPEVQEEVLDGIVLRPLRSSDPDQAVYAGLVQANTTGQSDAAEANTTGQSDAAEANTTGQSDAAERLVQGGSVLSSLALNQIERGTQEQGRRAEQERAEHNSLTCLPIFG